MLAALSYSKPKDTAPPEPERGAFATRAPLTPWERRPDPFAVDESIDER